MTGYGPPQRAYGEVFTRRWVAEVLLDLTEYTVNTNLAELRLVEPSCGSGAFLGPAVDRLVESATRHGHQLSALTDSIRAFDIQPQHVQASRDLCEQKLKEAGAPSELANHLASTWVRHGDFLLDTGDEQGADVVIGNPPYIRYDDLSEETAAAYRARWRTMRGRCDIYVGFIERALTMLKPNGKVGFICADRWMRNDYGSHLRAFVADGFSVDHVWTLHDVDVFETTVSAYPAITVISNQPQGPAVVADTTSKFTSATAKQLATESKDPAFKPYHDHGVAAHRLPRWFDGSGLWPTGSPARLALIEHLNDNFASLHNPATQTKVSIGIATGADSVYITKDPELVEADRLLPLAMRQDLSSGTFVWQGNYLVNPWTSDGGLVDLEDQPRLADYLCRHPSLKDRHVSRKSPNNWYRTIDKVQVGLVDKPKLLLQDMKSKIDPVLETGGHYPHHNLYYVTSGLWDMEVLGGILLSRIAQAFIEAYCVRMRGGTLRFQAQYLKQIRVPNPEAITSTTADDLRLAFRRRDVAAATQAAAQAYKIEIEEYELV